MTAFDAIGKLSGDAQRWAACYHDLRDRVQEMAERRTYSIAVAEAETLLRDHDQWREATREE